MRVGFRNGPESKDTMATRKEHVAETLPSPVVDAGAVSNRLVFSRAGPVTQYVELADGGRIERTYAQRRFETTEGRISVTFGP